MGKTKYVRGQKVKIGTEKGSVSQLQVLPAQGLATVSGMNVTSVQTTEVAATAKGYFGAEAMVATRQSVIPKIPIPSADITALSSGGQYLASEFSGIIVVIAGAQVSYVWGPWLQRVNNNPYQFYLGRTLAAGTAPPATTESYGGSSTNSVLGSIHLHLVGMRGSKRFGGSVELTLAPAEDYGIELGDKTKNIYLDLHRWLLRVYIRLTSQLFNTPGMLSSILPQCVSAEIEAFEVESYTLQGQRFVSNPNVAESDINGLLAAAENELISRLDMLARFALGFIHEQKLGDFTSAGWRVDGIQATDRFIEFLTTKKNPYVLVTMRAHYFGTSSLEGIFDSDAEVTAEPWLLLKESKDGFVVLSREKQEYIGSNTSTGMLTMGILSLNDIARVRHVLAFVGWTEDDPIENDFGGSNGFGFEVTFERATLQDRANKDDLGKIGETLYAFQNDWLEEKLSYAVEIEFYLVKR